MRICVASGSQRYKQETCVLLSKAVARKKPELFIKAFFNFYSRGSLEEMLVACFSRGFVVQGPQRLHAWFSVFVSVVVRRPLSLGFDIVIESATKYMNGHSDVIAGVVAGKQELINKVRLCQSLDDPEASRGLSMICV
eukprot:1157583-Pelagomonas_calceolata.AAC.6